MRADEIIPKGYISFNVDEASRSKLATQFPPKYADFVGHHITYKFGVPVDEELPTDTTATVIGYADDGDSLEALVVEINGSSKRPDGKIFHVTWSLDLAKGRKAMESNALLKSGKWTSVQPVNITMSAVMNPFN